MQRKIFSISLRFLLGKVIIGVTFLASCSQDLSDDNIPLAHFPDIVINLSLPSNIALASKGGIKALNDGGVRGIIIYCEEYGVYHAYERNCSLSPNEACATVNVDPSGLFLIDPCCTSSFNLTTGEPIGGPAWRPLRKYEAIAHGSELIITENIVN